MCLMHVQLWKCNRWEQRCNTTAQGIMTIDEYLVLMQLIKQGVSVFCLIVLYLFNNVILI